MWCNRPDPRFVYIIICIIYTLFVILKFAETLILFKAILEVKQKICEFIRLHSNSVFLDLKKISLRKFFCMSMWDITMCNKNVPISDVAERVNQRHESPIQCCPGQSRGIQQFFFIFWIKSFLWHHLISPLIIAFSQ